jgi:hypothetical protein
MSQAATLALLLLFPLIADAQNTVRASRKVPGVDKPVCSPGAICFSGEVSEGQEFHKTLNTNLEFVLAGGWGISIVPKRPESDCDEFASVVNAPYRAHRALDIDTSYGWTAEDEVSASPREFRFVTNCNDYRAEFERLQNVLWPRAPEKAEEALAKLGTSPLGKGRLWITDSKVSHAGDTADKTLGKIEWMTFRVEIILPRR